MTKYSCNEFRRTKAPRTGQTGAVRCTHWGGGDQPLCASLAGAKAFASPSTSIACVATDGGTSWLARRPTILHSSCWTESHQRALIDHTDDARSDRRQSLHPLGCLFVLQPSGLQYAPRVYFRTTKNDLMSLAISRKVRRHNKCVSFPKYTTQQEIRPKKYSTKLPDSANKQKKAATRYLQEQSYPRGDVRIRWCALTVHTSDPMKIE